MNLCVLAGRIVRNASVKGVDIYMGITDTKHSAAVLEEMHDQIVSRNERISELERELAIREI